MCGGGGGGGGGVKLYMWGCFEIFSVHYRVYNRDMQFAHVRNVCIDGNSICHMCAPSN